MSPRAQLLIDHGERELAQFRRDVEARARTVFGGTAETWPAFLRLVLSGHGYQRCLSQWVNTVRQAEAQWCEDEERVRKVREAREQNMSSATVAFPTVAERNTYMLQRRREGGSFAQIAREVGLSTARAREVVGRAEDDEDTEAKARRRREVVERRLSELPPEVITELERRITIKVPPVDMRHVWTPERQREEIEAERA